MKKVLLTVGEVARRSGCPISTLHFYERRGLIASERNNANYRVYKREILRRVAVIKVAQSAGVPLAEIAKALSHLPIDTTPTTREWERISKNWYADLTERIRQLTQLRDKMGNCIGCGCLSVKKCPLFNKNDHLSKEGPGPVLLK